MTAATTRRRVLLAVSGTIDPDVLEQVAADTRPCPDFVELAAVMDADLLDVPEARRRAGRWAWILERAGAGVLLAWVCFRLRRRYDAIFTDGEQVGIPLAVLCRLSARRQFPHVMIAHLLSPRKKSLPFRLFRLARYIDTIVVYCSAQERFVVEQLGVPPDRVVRSSFMVDTAFFSPARVTVPRERMIFTAGLEFRDYPTLMAAVDGLDVRVVIAAASPWSKRSDSTRGATLPANVEVSKLGFVDLRRHYAAALFVVMPLYENDFQAGITTILEAMAMGRAVVCSRTTGQRDVVVDGVTGVYVRPGDATALRAALTDLLADYERVDALGTTARCVAERDYDVRDYARRLDAAVEGAIERASVRMGRRGT